MISDERRAKVEELFMRHAKGVAGYALARVGDADAAESITSAVFEIVVRRIDQCRASPAAWLWSIVRTEIARHFRDGRARRDARAADVDGAGGDGLRDGAPGPAEVASRREQERRMRVALERLPDKQQKLVYLKFFLDLPNGEIAEALGTTPSNAGVMIHRAVKRLRELMEGRLPEGDGEDHRRADDDDRRSSAAWGSRLALLPAAAAAEGTEQYGDGSPA